MLAGLLLYLFSWLEDFSVSDARPLSPNFHGTVLFCILSVTHASYLPVGFAFVYFEDERDARDAIRGLDDIPFGHDRRRLSVEWARVCSLHISMCFTSAPVIESSTIQMRIFLVTS